MSNGLRKLVVWAALVASAGLATSAQAQSQQTPTKEAPPFPLPQYQMREPQQSSQQPSQQSNMSTVRDRISAAIERVQGACRKELTNFCGNVTPGEGRLLLCMQAHEDKLSNQCELALFEASRNIEQTVHRVERIAEACWNDIQAHCASGGSVGRCVIDKSASLSPSCRAVVAAVQQQGLQASQPSQQQQRLALTGRPIFSSDGVRLGHVTDVRTTSDGNVQMIQAEFGGMLGLGTTSVLITADEFEQMPDRLQLKMESNQVWSAIQGQKR